MTIDTGRVRALLTDFNLSDLFIEELGCDRPPSRQSEEIAIAGEIFKLNPIAHKRKFSIFHCQTIPDRNTRQKVEREIVKRSFGIVTKTPKDLFRSSRISLSRWMKKKRSP